VAAVMFNSLAMSIMVTFSSNYAIVCTKIKAITILQKNIPTSFIIILKI
jgi:hypothetical protein